MIRVPASRRGGAAAALLALAALAGVFYGSCLWGGRTLVLRDLYTQFYGARWWYQHSLASGSLPTWNPYVACGVPFLANPQNAVLYPLSLIFAVLPFGIALAWYAALHQVLLGLFCYLLARELGLGFRGALLAGIVAAWAGIPVKQIEFPEMTGGLAWTPLVLLAGWKCLNAPAARWAALGGAAFGLQLLAGSPYPPLYSCVGLACAILAAAPGARRRLAPGLGWLAAALLMGALVGCAQYLPTLLLARGLRVTELSGVMQARFSLRLRDLVDLAGPWFAGFPNWEKCFYVGITALFLALSALRPPAPEGAAAPGLSRPGWRFALLLAAAGLLFAQGSYLGTDRLLEAVPFLRRAGKWPTLSLSLAVLGFGLLAGEGLERWMGPARPGRRWLRPAGLAVLAGIAALLAADCLRGGVWLGAMRAHLEEPMLAFRPPDFADRGSLGPEAGRLALAAGALAAVLAAAASGRLRRAGAPLVCLLAAAELLSAGSGLSFRSPADLYAERAPAALKRLVDAGRGADKVRVLVPERFTRFADVAYGSRLARSFRVLRSLFIQGTVIPWRIFTTEQSGSMELPDYEMRLQPVLDNLAGASSWAAERTLGAWNIGAILQGDIDATGLHCDFVGNPYVLPRARLVGGNVNLPSADAALALISAGRWDPALVLTQSGDGLAQDPAASAPPGRVAALAYGASGIRIACEAGRPCFLVLAENWAPGWSARVDGSPSRLYRVNYLQQAVRLGAGRHEVDFEYTPPGERSGFLLAAFGLAGITCCGLSMRKKR